MIWGAHTSHVHSRQPNRCYAGRQVTLQQMYNSQVALWHALQPEHLTKPREGGEGGEGGKGFKDHTAKHIAHHHYGHCRQAVVQGGLAQQAVNEVVGCHHLAPAGAPVEAVAPWAALIRPNLSFENDVRKRVHQVPRSTAGQSSICLWQ